MSQHQPPQFNRYPELERAAFDLGTPIHIVKTMTERRLAQLVNEKRQQQKQQAAAAATTAAQPTAVVKKALYPPLPIPVAVPAAVQNQQLQHLSKSQPPQQQQPPQYHQQQQHQQQPLAPPPNEVHNNAANARTEAMILGPENKGTSVVVTMSDFSSVLDDIESELSEFHESIPVAVKSIRMLQQPLEQNETLWEVFSADERAHILKTTGELHSGNLRDDCWSLHGLLQNVYQKRCEFVKMIGANDDKINVNQTAFYNLMTRYQRALEMQTEVWDSQSRNH